VGDLASFLKGISIIVALYCLAFFIFGLGSFNVSNNNLNLSENSFVQQIDLGELASLEVIPDAALNETIYQNAGSSVSFSASTVLPAFQNTLTKTAENSNDLALKSPQPKKDVNAATAQIQTPKPTTAIVTKPIVKTSTTSSNTKINEVQNNLPKYAFPVETFDLLQYEIEAGKIKKGQVIGKILNKHQVDHQQIVKLSNKSKKVHDVRDINYGKKFMNPMIINM